jgi:inner membrane protein
MDSLTQIVLGAAIGELCMGKKIGNRAQLLGAIAGTIPDLDVVLTPFLNSEIDQLLVHRSYSHAIPVHILLAIPFALLSNWRTKGKYGFMSYYWLWFLGFATHAMLDACTTYGTQLWLPFTRHLIGLNNISIVDPLYTLPFMLLLIACLFMKRDSSARHITKYLAIGLSSLYMLGTFVVKYKAHTVFKAELDRKSISYNQLSTSPTILNAILWAGIAYNDSVIHTGEYSILQKSKQVNFVSYPRKTYLLDQVSDKKIVNTLRWFAQDKYFVEQKHADTVNVFLVKWGSTDFTKTNAEDRFLFYWKVYKNKTGKWEAKNYQPSDKLDIRNSFKQLWNRIFDK